MGPGSTRAHGVGGQPGAGQVGRQRAHEADDGMLRGAVGGQAAQAEQPGGRGHGHHGPWRAAGTASSSVGTTAAATLRTPFTLMSKSTNTQRGRPSTPTRAVPRRSRRHRHGGLQAPKTAGSLMHGALQVVPVAHVAHHRVHGGPMARRHGPEIRRRGQGVVERRVVSGTVERHHLPTGSHQPRPPWRPRCPGRRQ